MSEIVPKKPKEEREGEARPRTIWASDELWAELTLAAKREGYSVSKFVGFLIRGGFDQYKVERAKEAAAKKRGVVPEADKPASDEKP